MRKRLLILGLSGVLLLGCEQTVSQSDEWLPAGGHIYYRDVGDGVRCYKTNSGGAGLALSCVRLGDRP